MTMPILYSYLNNDQFDPFTGAEIDAGSLPTVTEYHQIPNSPPHYVQLSFIPTEGFTFTLSGANRTLVSGVPGVGEARVDMTYKTGLIEFNAADAGSTGHIIINAQKSRGTIVNARLLNNLMQRHPLHLFSAPYDSDRLFDHFGYKQPISTSADSPWLFSDTYLRGDRWDVGTYKPPVYKMHVTGHVLDMEIAGGFVGPFVARALSRYRVGYDSKLAFEFSAKLYGNNSAQPRFCTGIFSWHSSAYVAVEQMAFGHATNLDDAVCFRIRGTIVADDIVVPSMVNSFHRYSAYYDGTNIRAYVDGVLKTTVQTSPFDAGGQGRFGMAHWTSDVEGYASNGYYDWVSCVTLPPSTPQWRHYPNAY